MNHALFGNDDRFVSEPTKQTLRVLHEHLAKVMGVTLIGNRLTVRFEGPPIGKKRGPNREVHMIILEVEDGIPCDYCQQTHDESFCPKEHADEVPQ